MGQFYYSAKAFDMLERLDPNPEYWEGKRGAAIGLFQMIIAAGWLRKAKNSEHFTRISSLILFVFTCKGVHMMA